MMLSLYLLGMVLSAAGYSYREGLKSPTRSYGELAADAFLVSLLWLPALAVYWPFVAGQARAARLKDARVQAALKKIEHDHLEAMGMPEVHRLLASAE